MIGPPANLAIGASCDMLHLAIAELWIDTVGLGSATVVADLLAFVDGRNEISDHEYDIVAQAVNERFMEVGHDHPVPYASQL